jgi:hypothetical protein
MKLIIAGGRDFNDYPLLESKCNFYLSKIDESVIIVSGGQKTEKDYLVYGADYLGEQYARENNYPVALFPALY